MEAQQCVELTGTNTPITHTTLSGLVCAGKLQRVFDETTVWCSRSLCGSWTITTHKRVVCGWLVEFCGGDSGGETPG